MTPSSTVKATAVLRGLLLDTSFLASPFDERSMTALLVAAAQEDSRASEAMLRHLGVPTHLAYDVGYDYAADVAGRQDGTVRALIEAKSSLTKFNWTEPSGEAEQAIADRRGWENIDQLTRCRLRHPGVGDTHLILLVSAARQAKLRQMTETGETGTPPPGVTATEWNNTPVAELDRWRATSWEALGEALRHQVPRAEVNAATAALPLLRLVARS